MDVYLASPNNQAQAAVLAGMPVLLSFGSWSKFLESYAQSFGSILLDSGAFSEFTRGKKVELEAYLDWVSMFPKTVNFAGLDDISGDWRRSLKNYERGGFPTFHDTDPPELLDDLIEIARERGNWLGIGLKPPRQKKGEFLQTTLDRIPKEIHVHGWALRAYRKTHCFGSVDSTNWWRDSLNLRARLPWLTPFECLEIIVKREQRELIEAQTSDQLTLGGI
jgi:hypothetical protein